MERGLALLIVAVIVGVVGFIGNFRKAFEKKEGDTMTNHPSNRLLLEFGWFAGGEFQCRRDIVSVSGGDFTRFETQINNPTININSPAVLRPGSAPPRPSLMIGRDDDVKALKDRLSTTTDGKTTLQVLTAIKGWPGVGKQLLPQRLLMTLDIEIVSTGSWTSLGQERNILSEMATGDARWKLMKS